MTTISGEASKAANENFRLFLQTWAPLRKFRKPIADNLSNRARPSLHMYCERCDSEQTFNIQNDPNSGWFYLAIKQPYEVELWRYLCTGCRSWGRLFML